MTTILTAYNENVQRYLMHAEKKASKRAKNELMEAFRDQVIAQGHTFTELFPCDQYKVLDEILYSVSGCGIWKIGADTIAKKAGVSLSTVTRCVKSIKKTGLLIVARLADKGAGKYVFVSKLHPNLKDILAQVFKLDKNKMTRLLTERLTEPKTAENVDTPGANGVFWASNLFNSFNLLKHAFKNNNVSINSDEIDAIKNEIDQDPIMTIEQQKEKLKIYASNPFQQLVFEFIQSMPFPQIIKDHAYKLALSVGSDATAKDFVIAKDVITQLVIRLENGYVVKTSIRAVFEAAYLDARKNRDNTIVFNDQDVKKTPPTRKIPFYNWLQERE